jgi:sterol desaturase/sphingolipid hydroxylase (fatty acid hydroxylase superfamily)
MLLSKAAYYADFAVYAVAVLLLMVVAAFGVDWVERLKWLVAFATGIAVWTLLEYLLHRFVLHQMPIFSDMHAAHHASPKAFIGTPTWLSFGVLWLVFFVPAWWGFSFNVAAGLVAGLMMGFLWYGILHHTIHHRRPRFLASRLTSSIHWHLRHHYCDVPQNFGVTTRVWDDLFQTAPCRDPRQAQG